VSRIVLVHWNLAEAEELAQPMRKAGNEVVCHFDAKANPRTLLADPPDVFVIDLARLPSQGRELGGFLRRAVAARRVPLVYVEGDPAKTAAVRTLLPDAVFTTRDRVLADVARALTAPASRPVVPAAMDAYSGAPLEKKLGLRVSSRVLLLAAPADFESALGSLPASASVTRVAAEPVDIVLFFARSPHLLEMGFGEAAAHVQTGGRLWILWKKRARGVARSLTQADVRAFGLAHGWVDYKVSAIDKTWSGLCFARRSADREAER